MDTMVAMDTMEKYNEKYQLCVASLTCERARALRRQQHRLNNSLVSVVLIVKSFLIESEHIRLG
jgi:hypothetical protein